MELLQTLIIHIFSIMQQNFILYWCFFFLPWFLRFSKDIDGKKWDIRLPSKSKERKRTGGKTTKKTKRIKQTGLPKAIQNRKLHKSLHQPVRLIKG